MAGIEKPYPTEIGRVNEHDVRIQWRDGHISEYRPFLLRCCCPCAQCVDEDTGRKMLKDENVDKSVHPLVIKPTGNYGVIIAWSDNHSTGIYTYERLRSLCTCSECTITSQE